MKYSKYVWYESRGNQYLQYICLLSVWVMMCFTCNAQEPQSTDQIYRSIQQDSTQPQLIWQIDSLERIIDNNSESTTNIAAINQQQRLLKKLLNSYLEEIDSLKALQDPPFSIPDSDSIGVALFNQISEELRAVVDELGESAPLFAYTIFRNDSSLLQVVHAGLVEEFNSQYYGLNLCINVPFDESFKSEIEAKIKFQSNSISERFIHYHFQEMDCYIKEFGVNHRRTTEYCMRLLYEVYQLDPKATYKTTIDFY